MEYKEVQRQENKDIDKTTKQFELIMDKAQELQDSVMELGAILNEQSKERLKQKALVEESLL